jgi:hypothetical protein
MNAGREQEASGERRQTPTRAAESVSSSLRHTVFAPTAYALGPSPLSPCFSALESPVLIDTLAIRK